MPTVPDKVGAPSADWRQHAGRASSSGEPGATFEDAGEQAWREHTGDEPALDAERWLSQRRWGRQKAVEVRRNQDLVVRLWAITVACTAVPVALVKGENAPFPPAMAWVFGLCVLTLVSAFAAWATRRNALVLDGARSARRESVDASLTPLGRPTSVKALLTVSWLFRALTAAYGIAATLVVARLLAAGLAPWQLALLALPWLGALWPPRVPPGPSPLPYEAVTLMPKRLDASHRETERSLEAKDRRAPSEPSAEPQDWRPTTRAPSEASSSRPSLELGQSWDLRARASGASTRSSSASSLGEALGSVLPPGAELRPELRASSPLGGATFEQPFTQYRRHPTRLDSGVQELKKPLTEPQRRPVAPETRLSQIATEPPPSTDVIDSSERDTERPPSRRTERAEKPLFRESDIPTTPAPARTREASPPDGPSSAMLAFELKIPKSPRAPTFGKTDRAKGAAPDADQSFRPTHRAGPFVERGGDALAEALSRSTRPASGSEPELDARFDELLAKPREYGSDPMFRDRANADGPLEETPKPASFTRGTGSATPSPSQFDLAYSRFESEIRARRGSGDPNTGNGGVREAAPRARSSAASDREYGSSGGQLHSEIRWVDSAPSTVPLAMTLENDLLETLQGARPRAQTAPKPRRKRALH